MKESSDRELYRNLVCIWDEGNQQLIETDYEIPQSGIYHIRIGDESYIGKSVNLYKRLQDHLNGIFKRGNLGSENARKKFEKVRTLSIYIVCECSEKDLDDKERYYIEKYQPTLNKQLVNNKENFELITTSISAKNKQRLSMCKIYGYDGVQFSSKGEVISAILDFFFKEYGEPKGMR